SAVAGMAISPAVQVTAQDKFGNIVPSASVTMSLLGNGTLSGTKTQTTDGSGIATFADLSVDRVGTKDLTASGGSARGVSNDFIIPAAAASQLAFSQQPTDTIAGANISPAVKVQVTDAFGNAIAQGGATVSLDLTTGVGPLNGTLSQSTDASGIA